MGKYEKFNYGESPHGFSQINKNFDEIGTDIDEIKEELSKIYANDLYRDVSILCDSEGQFTVFEPNKHPGMKLISGFIQAADNIKQTNTIRLLYGRKERELSKATIKSTEKSGKTHSLTVTAWKSINQYDQLIIKTNNLLFITLKIF